MDSMILGESQILGQVRDALHSAQAESTVGPALNALFQQALRIGKRGHAETGIDRLAPSIVTAGLDAAGAVVDAADTRFLVAGAGTMASLAVRTLIERGVEPRRIMVANRTYQRAYDLVATFGVSAVRWQALDVELAAADVLISCTGASGVVFDRDRIEPPRRRPAAWSLIDLALPRDIDPRRRATLDGVDAGRPRSCCRSSTANAELAADVAQVRSIVEDEVRTFLAAKAASHITPTVVALRTMATDVVAAEQAPASSRGCPTSTPTSCADGPQGAAPRRREAHPRADRAGPAARRRPGGPDLRRRAGRSVRARPVRGRRRDPSRGETS